MSSYWDSNMNYTFKIIYIYNNMSVYTILFVYYIYIYIMIKEWVKRSWFFTHNYGDIIAWNFETYAAWRWAIVVCGIIDFIYVLVKENTIKEK